MKQRSFQENTVDVGDALKIMAEMPANSVDIAITSPPYNTKGGSKGNVAVPDRYYGQFNDSLSAEDYRGFIFEALDLLLKVTRHYVFFNVQNTSGNGGIGWDIVEGYRRHIKDTIIWAKVNPNPQIAQGIMANGYEFIFCMAGGLSINNRVFERRSFERKDHLKNVIIEPVNSRNPYSYIHSATFPPWLPGRLIKWFSIENDLIFDPFVGCGETVIQAIKQNRRYYACDISPEYVAITNQRIKDITSQINLF